MIGKSFLSFLIVLSASIAAAADRLPSPDKALIAIIEPFLKSNGKAAENFVRIVQADGDPLVEMDFRSTDKEHGLIVDKIQWSADSNFFVFSTYSSGGHQPWNSPTFFYARSDNHIRRIDKIIGLPIVDPDFRIVNPDTLIIYVRDEKTNADKKLLIRLTDLLKK